MRKLAAEIRETFVCDGEFLNALRTRNFWEL